ncbi:MAG: EcsC family protein [Deltaproteobacteria bacterium]
MTIARDHGEYEKEQIRAIDEWRREKTGAIGAALGFVIFPISVLIQTIIPKEAIQNVLSGASATAEMLTDEGDVIRKGDVAEIEVLRKKDLRLSDQLANEIHNWAIGIASAEGVGSGMWGIYGLALDIPFIITFALRTIHKIGICYGYRNKDENGKRFVLALLSAASANTVSEKAEAVKLLQAIDLMIAKQTMKTVLEKAVQQQFAKEAVLLSVKNLGRQLGINITERKVLQVIPAIGAAVGGSVNAWFINDVAWAARRAFQERWLIENDKLEVEFSLTGV